MTLSGNYVGVMGISQADKEGGSQMPWKLRKKPTRIPQIPKAPTVKPIKPVKPVKPTRPVKPIAPIGYGYYWKDDPKP